MMEVEQLYEILRKVQEPKGYFFNKDKEKVFAPSGRPSYQ